jgi:hypothetical protein
METVYEIREFDLIGDKMYTVLERTDVQVVDADKGIFKDENGIIPRNGYYTLVTSLMGYAGKKLFSAENKFLPYFADVTQDRNIPEALKDKITLETYKNCQLLAEKHGAYLQFFDHATGEVHRIALNSNSYTPVKL